MMIPKSILQKWNQTFYGVVRSSLYVTTTYDIYDLVIRKIPLGSGHTYDPTGKLSVQSIGVSYNSGKQVQEVCNSVTGLQVDNFFGLRGDVEYRNI